MEIAIETVKSVEDESAMWRIRREVFERELGITLAAPEVANRGAIAHLLARVGPGRDPVGTLSLIDTSGDSELHRSLGLRFESNARVARYTHLAVIKSYRRRSVPLMMMLEAHRQFVLPLGIRYTWLLFDAERAPASFLSRHLGFQLLPGTFVSEYGCRRPLVRDERAAHSALAIERAERFLSRPLKLPPAVEVAPAY